MDNAQIGALLIGSSLGMVLTVLGYRIADRLSRRRARKAKRSRVPNSADRTGRVGESQLHVPIANPTTDTTTAAPRAVVPPASREQRTHAATPAQTAASTNTEAVEAEMSRLRAKNAQLAQDFVVLKKQALAVNQQNSQLSSLNASLVSKVQTAAHDAQTSEADLKLARHDIAEIRQYVLQLGGSKTGRDVIDLR